MTRPSPSPQPFSGAFPIPMQPPALAPGCRQQVLGVTWHQPNPLVPPPPDTRGSAASQHGSGISPSPQLQGPAKGKLLLAGSRWSLLHLAAISAPRRGRGWQDASNGTGLHSLAKGFGIQHLPVPGGEQGSVLEVSLWGGCSVPPLCNAPGALSWGSPGWWQQDTLSLMPGALGCVCSCLGSGGRRLL